jgi:UDP-glucose-4-epimerase GalE
MARGGVRRIVFSSTAAVYGNPEGTPITEDMPHKPVNPYGHTKLMVEQAMRWMDEGNGLRFVALRYFNACGAEAAFGIGEEHEPESHLIPLVFRAIRTGKPLTVFGADYPTPDGTCVRDYVHVSDLAQAHSAALDHLLGDGASHSFNAGTGQGFSVLEVIKAVERVTGKTVPYEVGPQRAGDPAILVADSTRLQQTLGWKPDYTTLDSMVESAWKFDSKKHA